MPGLYASAMRFREVYLAIPRLFSFFSERVSVLFRRLLEKLAGEYLRVTKRWWRL